MMEHDVERLVQRRGESYIHRYAEPVKKGYSVLREDVVIDGEIVPELCIVRGSPAPTETVKRHEEKIAL